MNKTIKTICDDVAKENGFVHWLEILEDHIDTELYWPEVCKRYAIEVANASLENIKSKIQDDSGIEGCTYGDTQYDSITVVYGYNLCVEHVKEIMSDEKNIAL